MVLGIGEVEKASTGEPDEAFRSQQVGACSSNYQVTKSIPALFAIVRVDVNHTYRLQ